MAKSKKAARLAELAAQIRVCTRCPLYESRTLAVPGDGKQEHHASMLHFDFRLEMDGVLKSWSIRKGPSLDPREKRLAVMTEDHPVEYLKFEGRIPEGNYGAGEHMIWDQGTYQLTADGEPGAQLEAGRISFLLKGDKLRGEFHLVRMAARDKQWLLIKSRDEFAEPGWRLPMLLDDGGGDTGEPKNGRPARRKRAAGERVKKYIPRERKKDVRVISASRAFKSVTLSGDINIRVGRETVELTSLDKPYWPDDGYTKGDLVTYYYEVSKYILPYLKARPLIMKRYPNGIKAHSFHQHDVDEAPGYVQTATLEVEEGHHAVNYIVGNNLATLLYMANLGAIECHPWHSRITHLDRPDWFVFDLDPGEGVTYPTICEVALSVRDILGRFGLDCYAKTSGSRGMHVYVPIKPVYSYQQIADFAEQVATLVTRENPETATIERSLKKRKRKTIYLDHLQNARGKSVVAPYSVRPREEAPVSAPLEWKEVGARKITPRDFTIKNMLKRLDRKGDLFEPVLSRKQRLDDAFEEAESLVKKSRARRARA